MLAPEPRIDRNELEDQMIKNLLPQSWLLATFSQKSHSAGGNNYGQCFELKIALFTIILALMAFLYIKIAKKKYTITRKKRRT